MIVQQGIIASSLQNLLTKTVRSLNDYSVITYTLCSFSAPEGEVPFDWFGFTETFEFASTTYSLCSFSISEDELSGFDLGFVSDTELVTNSYELCSYSISENELSASNLGFVFVSDQDLLTNLYELCSFSVPTNELTDAYPLSATDAINAFRTSIYGVSSNVLSALNIIAPDRIEFSYWETTTDGVNYSILSDYQNTTLLYAYLSGNSLPHDASVMNVSARHVVGYNFHSYKSLPIALKPYSSILDIPNLQAWFDSSDGSYVTTQVTYPSADGNTKLLTLQNSTLVDNSPNNLRLVNNGVTFSYQPTLNSYCGDFNGSSRIDVENILGSNFLNNDYTIEFWVYGGGHSNTILTFGGTHLTLTSVSSTLRPRIYGGPTGAVNYSGGAPTALIPGQWNHIALIKTGNTYRFFTNGNGDTTTGSQTAGVVYSVSRVTIGCRFSGATPLDYFNGSISNLRIYSGESLYTYVAPAIDISDNAATITPSQLLIVDNDPYVTNSPWASGVSGHFPGNAGLSFPYSETYVPGASADFTIEAWVYPIAVGAPGAQIIGSHESGTGADWGLFLNSAYRAQFYVYISATPGMQSTNSLSTYQWHHIAIVRSGTTGPYNLKMYVNGTLEAQTFYNGSLADSRYSYPFTIGSDNGFNETLFNGYINDVRIIVGSAAYSGGTVPTAPLTKTADTKFLLNFRKSLSGPTPVAPLSSITSPSALSQLRVTNWRDKSLNSLSATTDGAMNRFTLPSYRNSGLPSGLSSLDFDGIDDTMEVTAPITISEDFTSIFVYERPYGGAISQTIGTSDAAAASPYLHWTNDYIYTGNEVLQSPIGFSGGTSGIGAVRKNQMFAINDPNWSWNTINFAPLTVNWSGSNTSVSLDSIGRYNATSYHRGQYHEYIQTKCMLPDAEIQLVLSKLRDKWFVPTLAPQMIIAPYISIGNYFIPIIHVRAGTWGNMSLDPNQPTDAYVIIAQKSFDGVSYTDIPGASAIIPHTYGVSPTLSYQPTNSDYGAYIRGRTVVKNSVGSSPELYTNSYVLTAYNTSAPTLTRTSIWNVTVNPGSWYSTITINAYYYKWEYTTNGGSTWQPLGALTTNDTVSLSSLYTGTPIDVRVTVYPLTNITELPS